MGFRDLRTIALSLFTFFSVPQLFRKRGCQISSVCNGMNGSGKGIFRENVIEIFFATLHLRDCAGN